ncbi:MAG: TRZ/ATZ family hydrolase [Kangiellaceae bacterium]|jgi:5-methylthioadenosine/S-adenosylhomocysteine deaminase|nr:TRZ/ATZ family hydrolase [Kangiellaceae bacterium]
MKQADTLLLAKWLEPVGKQQNTQTDTGVAIKDGKIIAIDRNHLLERNYSAEQVVHLDNHLLLPGLINCHTHAAMSLLKGYANDLPLMTWLNDHIWPVEGEFVSDEFVYEGTQLAMAEMLRGGITCFNDMYFMPDMTAKAVSEIGMRANIGLIVIDFPSAWASDANQYIANGLKVFDQYKADPMISFSLAPHAPYTVSDEPLQKLNTYAEELGLTVHMHVHETAQEVNDAQMQNGIRPIERLDQLGLLSPSLMAVHMTQLSEQDMSLVERNGVHVVHCPESNMKLASGIAPISQLINNGVNVALGTDGSASNNDLDLIGEARTAALLAKVSSLRADQLTAFQALKMMTINGAKALGLSDQIGSIEVSKAADLIAIDMASVEMQPVYDPVAQLIYSGSREQVSHVWINGKVQLDNNRLINLSENGCLAIADKWQRTITDKNK